MCHADLSRYDRRKPDGRDQLICSFDEDEDEDILEVHEDDESEGGSK